MRFETSATLTAENTFTGWTQLFGPFILEISGVTDSTVTFQSTRDGGTTILDVETFTSDTFQANEMPFSTCLFRAGIKTGHYGSDTVKIVLEG